MINKKETKMSLAIIGMALVATVITMSTPIPTLSMGHWNSDEDYVSNTGFTDLTISPLVESAFADHGQEIVLTSKDGQKTVFTSKDSQTITNPSLPPPTTMTTTTTTPVTYVVEEICNDGIDNDSDTLIDFSDEECNPLQSQQQPILSQQGQTMVSTSEICDDDRDNDFDGKVDSRDDECNSITTSSSFPPPIQGQPVNNQQIGEDGGKEQQSNEDISEESGEKEDSDDEANKDSNDDENEDEDEEQQSNDEDNDDDDDKEDE
ncbi:MAG TPA: hypothetical protein VFS97_12685 [Nitrososphaeraceae archaeon]|nr:hypothetical protein [Nitrososphaeraceae archaeon]